VYYVILAAIETLDIAVVQFNVKYLRVLDDDDDVYLESLQTRGVKKSILSQCETLTTANKA
jgi:hypothetical protein